MNRIVPSLCCLNLNHASFEGLLPNVFRTPDNQEFYLLSPSKKRAKVNLVYPLPPPEFTDKNSVSVSFLQVHRLSIDP
jgi:hypothetical protein